MNNYSKHYQNLIFVLLGVVAFSLNVLASRDWQPYLKQFKRLTEYSWPEMFSIFTLFEEPFFYFNAKFWGELISFPAFIAVSTIILLCLKLNYLQKLSTRPFIAVYIYLCAYLFLFEGTVLRVAYATAFIIPALYFLSKGHWWPSFFLWFMATLIHFSTSIFLIALPLFFLSFTGFRFLLAFFVLSPLLIVFEFSVFDELMKLVRVFREDYVSYGHAALVENQNSSGMFYYFLLFYYCIILFAITLLWQRLKTDRTLKMIAGQCMVAIIVMCSLYDHVLVAARLGELLLVVSPVLLAEATEGWPFRGKKYLTVILLGGFTLIALARFAYLYPTLIA